MAHAIKIGAVHINPEAVALVAPYRGGMVQGIPIPPREGEDVEILLVNGYRILATGTADEIAETLGLTRKAD